MNLGLSGKCALVTGASKGLGKAIAEELAKEGAHISICARGVEDLEQTAQALRAYEVTVAAIQADVAKAEEVPRSWKLRGPRLRQRSIATPVPCRTAHACAE